MAQTPCRAPPLPPPRHAGEGGVPAASGLPGRGRVEGRQPSDIGRANRRPPSTLPPLCTQGVRPGSTELHFMVTKTTMPPSRNCQQRLCARVFGPIFAEPTEPRLLRDIDLDLSLTRKSGVPMPACPSAGLPAFGKCPASGRVCGVLADHPLGCCHCYFSHIPRSLASREDQALHIAWGPVHPTCRIRREGNGKRRHEAPILELEFSGWQLESFSYEVPLFITGLSPVSVHLQFRVLLLPIIPEGDARPLTNRRD